MTNQSQDEELAYEYDQAKRRELLEFMWNMVSNSDAPGVDGRQADYAVQIMLASVTDILWQTKNPEVQSVEVMQHYMFCFNHYLNQAFSAGARVIEDTVN